jgi:hypothetical protein
LLNQSLVKGLRKFLGLEKDEELEDYDIKHFSTNSEALVGDVVYDPDVQELYVTYTGGGKYTYYNVSPKKFSNFQKAGSRGSYINYYIKQQGYIYSKGAF